MNTADAEITSELLNLVLHPKEGSPNFDYSLRGLGNEETIYRAKLSQCPSIVLLTHFQYP